jgi:ABC-type branched-subunit amino acid transport system substrate-binding protein
LSGDYAAIGQPIADSIEYAIDQANADESSGLRCELAIETEDSQGDPNVHLARRSANSLAFRCA